jgi:hypothetical protein
MILDQRERMNKTSLKDADAIPLNTGVIETSPGKTELDGGRESALCRQGNKFAANSHRRGDIN